jgi:nucleotide-binding universal stress UspA family protein
MAKVFHKILCPVDFDDNSIAALELGCKIAVENGASVCLMHVLPLPVTASEIGPVPLESYSVLEQDAQAKLEKIRLEKVPPEIPCDIITSVGAPAPAIVEAEKDKKADLIVMATHGRKRSAVGHFFLGSVAERVVREAACPVLIVPPR